MPAFPRPLPTADEAIAIYEKHFMSESEGR